MIENIRFYTIFRKSIKIKINPDSKLICYFCLEALLNKHKNILFCSSNILYSNLIFFSEFDQFLDISDRFYWDPTQKNIENKKIYYHLFWSIVLEKEGNN